MLTSEPIDSLLSVYVEYSDEMNHLLMIEGDVTKRNKSIGQFKDDSVFLLNDVESNFHDKPIENMHGET